VDQQTQIQLWLTQDGAPAHFLPTFWEFFNNTFLKQWMGRCGPTAWNAHFSDLNPLDFYLWG
jgi:hypothetical protein